VLPPDGAANCPGSASLQAALLGQFSIRLEKKVAGPWRRPPSKHLCELVLLSPLRRVGRETVIEALFPRLDPTGARAALSQALSYARTALSALGDAGTALLQSDRALIWVNPEIDLMVDLDVVHGKMRDALTAEPGWERDNRLLEALADQSVLLEDEPFADWVLLPREQLERARQEARLELARDRARGFGRSRPAAVVDAWEACLAHDATCEEAAAALMRIFSAQDRHALAQDTYERCRDALGELRLRASPALDEIHRAMSLEPSRPRARPTLRLVEEERRLVTMLFVEVTPARGIGDLGLDEFRQLVSTSLADVVGHVESLGATVSSVSGAGLVAIFGAPESHEDDPERALRAAYRAVARADEGDGDVVLRAGVESGQAVVGTLDSVPGVHHGALGEVVSVAASLQAAARPASVLVGPAAKAATEGLFEWGLTEEVATSAEAKPLVCWYLGRPRPRPSGQAGRKGLARKALLVGRADQVGLLRDVLDGLLAGQGATLVIAGDPGLGKTRLVYECRRLFMAWVGASSRRLPLWLEGRAASYAASAPFGLYQHVLGAWVGAAPDEPDETVRAALDRAMKVLFRDRPTHNQLQLLCKVMLGWSKDADATVGLTPEQIQRAIFAVLREVVSRLVAQGPTVLVLEDLHWADPTSLHLTEKLATVVHDGPLLLLMTRRPEPDPGVSALEEAIATDQGPKFRRVDLAPLTFTAERELARALLGEGARDEVVDLITQSTEGNPLFLEERFSSLMASHALVRSGNTWQVDQSVEDQLPEALERLILSRVDRMGWPARKVLVAASVLGAEFSLSSLASLSPVDHELRRTLADLSTAGLITELSGSAGPAYRFRHALIQDAAYKGLLREERRQLHGKVAWALEESWHDRREEIAALLGHHFAAAGEVDRAGYYFELAGDRAATVFANEEAVTSYRAALSLAGDGNNRETPQRRRGVVLRTKLVEVLWRAGRLTEALSVSAEAMRRADGLEPSLSARLYLHCGRIEQWRRRFGPMLIAFQTADALLKGNPEHFDQATFDLWFDVQMEGLATTHYWRDEPEQAQAVLEKVRPALDARGGPRQRQQYEAAVALWLATKNRHRADEEMIATSRRALTEAEGCCDQFDMGWRVFNLGWCLFLHGDLTEAEQRLTRSLAIAGQIGSPEMEALSLCYLTLTALRRHDAAQVEPLASRAAAAANAAVLPEYGAMARASLVWLTWQKGHLSEVGPMAEGVLQLWSDTAWHPFHWVCVFPLIDVRLSEGRTAEAVEASRQLLVPPQQRLPDELESAVQSSIEAWNCGKPDLASRQLRAAVKLAQRLRFA
jgi:DNA-binding SARP family transcriptional activator/tetratricopeptide (TPR) repeat protein